MADTKESYESAPAADKSAPATTYAEDVAVDNDGLGALPADRPSGWMYRERKVGPVNVTWYASPMFQLLMVSFVCFTCPGMFNALTGLGGGGRNDDGKLASDMVNIFFSLTFLESRLASCLVGGILGMCLAGVVGGEGCMGEMR
ncbi:hypothetical protein V496_05694 [Pseudogymnoascus sp. VKM F-4515 (FW-2607)]